MVGLYLDNYMFLFGKANTKLFKSVYEGASFYDENDCVHDFKYVYDNKPAFICSLYNRNYRRTILLILNIKLSKIIDVKEIRWSPEQKEMPTNLKNYVPKQLFNVLCCPEKETVDMELYHTSCMIEYGDYLIYETVFNHYKMIPKDELSGGYVLVRKIEEIELIYPEETEILLKLKNAELSDIADLLNSYRKIRQPNYPNL